MKLDQGQVRVLALFVRLLVFATPIAFAQLLLHHHGPRDGG